MKSQSARGSSRYSAAQPTQSNLSSPTQMAIMHIPMCCSQTQKLTSVYLSCEQLLLSGTGEGTLIHPDKKQQQVFHKNKKKKLKKSNFVSFTGTRAVRTAKRKHGVQRATEWPEISKKKKRKSAKAQNCKGHEHAASCFNRF